MTVVSDRYIEWTFTDEVHSDAGGAGIRFHCPDCGKEMTEAGSRWWDLECRCPGRRWNVDVCISYEDSND